MHLFSLTKSLKKNSILPNFLCPHVFLTTKLLVRISFLHFSFTIMINSKQIYLYLNIIVNGLDVDLIGFLVETINMDNLYVFSNLAQLINFFYYLFMCYYYYLCIIWYAFIILYRYICLV